MDWITYDPLWIRSMAGSRGPTFKYLGVKEAQLRVYEKSHNGGMALASHGTA